METCREILSVQRILEAQMAAELVEPAVLYATITMQGRHFQDGYLIGNSMIPQVNISSKQN